MPLSWCTLYPIAHLRGAKGSVGVSGRPEIGGNDYSVFKPERYRQGIRLWTQAFVRALQEREAGTDGIASATDPQSEKSDKSLGGL